MRQRCLLVVLLVMALGCRGASHPTKPKRSVLWVASGSEIGLAELGKAEGVGIGEAFVEAGRLSFRGGSPGIEPLPTFSLPQPLGVTLVVRGDWGGGDVDADAAASALAGGLDSVRAAAAGRGLTGLGYHLDVDYGGNLASWAKTMAALRKKVDRRLYLSANLKRSSLGSSEAEDLASAADFLVVFLYGQRPPEREEATAWDLQKVEKDLRLVEKLGRPYLLGVVTLGRSFHLGPRGEVLAESSEIAVGPLARSSSFQLGRGFSLEGVDRLVYSFQAQEPVTVGPWRLSRGQSVRLIGLARYYIEELSRRLEALDLDHYRGTAYYRFAGANEPTSLSLDTLARALSSDSSKPQVGVTLEPAGGRRFRVTIENLSEERSDIAVLGSNFVEVEAAAGGVLSRVDPGEFQRWELLRKNSDGELVRDFRDATTLRLFTPILEPHERRTSGTFEVSGRAGTPTAHAKFLFPGGIAVEAQSQSSTGSP